ncbi:bifunctional heptose 7-phosphate kinase/heptose 1-phosphate adenyltransferase [Acetonema longum]|uniref:PfkB domain protein n=1 Tax=Acetonema longum DSM 6540 TaxID=1009370 RepID=F7NLY7_9FIRM|nr:PfkB family carbohydrate kinase [Acetonema longum]EGO62913.1 PfkB domain protein [Acetonema longum DSM 6540]
MDNSLLPFVQAMQNQPIMLIGDMVADVYLEGRISRISREAPVLILEHAGETVVPGGAANAVHNVAALGGDVFAVGVIGDDGAGQSLTQVLTAKAAHTQGLIADSTRPTITKTRIMAGGQATVRQQVVRIDREEKKPLSEPVEAAVLNYIRSHVESMAVVVMSDYGGQSVSPAVRKLVLDTCRPKGIPTIVDSRYDILSYTGVTVVKQNESEAAAAVGSSGFVSETALLSAGKTLLSKLKARAVLITRGPDGMTLFEPGDKVTQVPVVNRSEVYDVTGAGDTVVAAMALAMAAGASYPQAAQIATFAAGIVVRKLGTATATPAELAAAIEEYIKK